MMKTLIEGEVLLDKVPRECNATGVGPTVRLANNLILDDGNCFQGPLLIEGKVGSGKTTLMKSIMDAVLCYADKVSDNVVIFCAKPEMLRYKRPEDVVISITSTNPDFCWNLFSEMHASSNPTLTLREIASELFSEATQKTMQPFFPQAARDLFVQTGRYLYDFSVETGKPVDNENLVKILVGTPIRREQEKPGWLDLAEMRPNYFSMARDYMGGSSDQGYGVLSELRTLISTTLFDSFASRNGRFSAIETLKSGGKRVFLYYDYAKAGHSTLSVLRIILDLLLKEAMNIDAPCKTWFFLDEASLLPRSDVLVDALSLGRDPGSTGRGGVRIIMALQSARLMTHHYTQSEAEALLSLFPNVIAMQVQDPMSRALVSERYGKAHYQYYRSDFAGKTIYTDAFEDVVSDFHFSKLTKAGQAIMSLPGVCKSPFFYNGYGYMGEC